MGFAKPEDPGATLGLPELKVVNLVGIDMSDRLATYVLTGTKDLSGREPDGAIELVAETSDRFGFLQPVLLGLWATGAGRYVPGAVDSGQPFSSAHARAGGWPPESCVARWIDSPGR